MFYDTELLVFNKVEQRLLKEHFLDVACAINEAVGEDRAGKLHTTLGERLVARAKSIIEDDGERDAVILKLTALLEAPEAKDDVIPPPPGNTLL